MQHEWNVGNWRCNIDSHLLWQGSCTLSKLYEHGDQTKVKNHQDGLQCLMPAAPLRATVTIDITGAHCRNAPLRATGANDNAGAHGRNGNNPDFRKHPKKSHMRQKNHSCS